MVVIRAGVLTAAFMTKSSLQVQLLLIPGALQLSTSYRNIDYLCGLLRSRNHGMGNDKEIGVYKDCMGQMWDV